MLSEEKFAFSRSEGPDRPLAFEFDFIVFFQEQALLQNVLLKGVLVAALHWTLASLEYDLVKAHVMEWLSYLLAEG